MISHGAWTLDVSEDDDMSMSDKDLTGRDISLGLAIVSGIVRIVEMIVFRLQKPKPEPKPDIDRDDDDRDDNQRGGPCWSTPPYECHV